MGRSVQRVANLLKTLSKQRCMNETSTKVCDSEKFSQPHMTTSEDRFQLSSLKIATMRSDEKFSAA
jgi:hypothetical protein